MSVREYSLKFTNLSKYTPLIVADPRARMRKFISEMVPKECKTIMLVKEMYISHFVTYVEKIEQEKLRVNSREFKRAWVESGGFFHQRVSSHESKVDKRKWTKVQPTPLFKGSTRSKGPTQNHKEVWVLKPPQIVQSVEGP